jgi:hypothetical protein
MCILKCICRYILDTFSDLLKCSLVHQLLVGLWIFVKWLKDSHSDKSSLGMRPHISLPVGITFINLMTNTVLSKRIACLIGCLILEMLHWNPVITPGVRRVVDITVDLDYGIYLILCERYSGDPPPSAAHPGPGIADSSAMTEEVYN